ncbi:MAG: dCTP deaminase [Verrucomicrobia bacterium]|nr:dCTP deaminase [Verrucomicrobiota bacterium]MCH8527439.1 dCTP deaminase [Kiritimatiellia bacterium]
MIKNDNWITASAQAGMIKPFSPSLVSQVDDRRVLSFGLSSFGYDIRLSPEDFRIFRHIPGTVIDPKKFNPANLEQVELQKDAHGEFFILPAHSYGLGVALEYLKVPPNISVLCIGKSTYARIGCIANLTPAEAGWEGHLTLEISNASHADCRIYANEGIVQLIFFEGEACDTCYATRQGKYQHQKQEVTLPRV